MSSYEYNQLLKFLYFEGYVDSYAEAEELLESMSDEDFEQILEKKDIPQEIALKIANTLKGAPKFSRRGRIAAQLRQYAVERNAKRIAKLQQNNEEVVEYLFVEGFADTIENAEVMAENISEQWIDEILNEMEVQPPKEPLKTDRNMFNIPADEKEAARERTLAKAKAMRAKKGL